MLARTFMVVATLLFAVPAHAERLFLPDAGPRGRAAQVLRVDPAVARAVTNDRRARMLSDVPLIDGGSATFAVAPVEVFAKDATVVEFDGVRSRVIGRPEVVAYEGKDVATPGRTLVLVVTGGTRVSAIVRDGQRVTSVIQPSGTAHAFVDPAAAPAGPPRQVCGNHDGASGTLGSARAVPRSGPPAPGLPPPGTLATEVLVDVGNDLYVNQFESNSTTAAEYAASLFGAVSAIYRRDTDVAILVSQLVVWTSPDPFAGPNTAVQLGAYRDWNEANRVGVPRDTAHLLANIGDGGRAFLPGICTSFAYGVSNVDGYYSVFSTTGYEWDINVIAHELGHNLGSGHTHCYSPAIDHCYNAEPGCYAGPVEPSVGETMSYCHLVETIEMGFGGVVGPVIRAGAEANGCIGAAPGVCGNGVLENGEQCDDGNVADGDCCAANCASETGSPCTSDGDVCTTDVCTDDGVCGHVPPGTCSQCDLATVIPSAGGSFVGTAEGASTLTSPCGGFGPEKVFQWTPAASGIARVDTCGSVATTTLQLRAGSCAGGSHVACNTFGCGNGAQLSFYAQAGTPYYLVVDTASTLQAGDFALNVSAPGCAPAPLSGCKLPTASGKATFKLKDALDDAKDQLQWKWGSGAATTMTEFGTPTSADGYQLCVYHGGGVALAAAVPPAGTCGTKPCWSTKSTSHNYKNKARTPEGIEKLQLKSSLVPGKAQISVGGKAGLLAMPNLLGLTPPIRVQITRPGGPCWEATYSAPIVKPDGSQLSGKSD